jgi:hypothetical protein
MIIALDIVMIICFFINCPTVICLPIVCYFFKEASSENYGPRVYLNHILKTLKIPCCTFILFILFYILVSIYHIQFNLAINRRGIDNPSFALGARICCLCAGTANEVLRGSPTGLITLVS